MCCAKRHQHRHDSHIERRHSQTHLQRQVSSEVLWLLPGAKDGQEGGEGSDGEAKRHQDGDHEDVEGKPALHDGFPGGVVGAAGDSVGGGVCDAGGEGSDYGVGFRSVLHPLAAFSEEILVVFCEDLVWCVSVFSFLGK